jgi:EAL domain-containing protein (putative c-di-GMP-specific phosphodiesterase class I)
VAEETGMIGDLSFNVMEQALIEARDWDPGICVAVNISPMQLRDPLLAHRLLKLMVATRFPPERLEVEITESALLGDLGTAKAVITSLKNQGVRLALDDFGTGYSSLHHLRALPFDRIKIDRSFVSSILENDESAAIVHAVLGLGASLGIEVTAEGIETGAIAERLRTLKCGNGQGYYYSRPVPADAVGDTLDRVRTIASRVEAPFDLPAEADRKVAQ